MKKILLTVAVMIGLTASTLAQVPNYVSTNGLVGWWPFNGNTNDESGNGLNGTGTGSPTLTQDRFSVSNKAYSFDGIDDYISVARNYQTAFSLSIWFKPSNSPQYNPLVDAFDANWEVQLKNTSPDYVSFITPNNYQEFVSTQTTTTSNWYHLVCTYSSNTLTFYLNGNQTDQFTVNALPNNNGNYHFGASLTGADQFYNGKLDDIGIWNRALTQSEVIDLYNSCSLNVSIQPINQNVLINNNAQFIIVSSDNNATYQWQTDLGVGFQNLNSVGQYSGTTNDTLNITNVTSSNNNQPFRCIISSGLCKDTSNVAVLTVNNNVGIAETSQDNLFKIFPNPAQSVINLIADNKLLGEVFTIYDNKGSVILSGKINLQNTTIELMDLPLGIYILSVGENMKQTFKIIKE